MAVTQPQHKQSWKDAAIARSQGITDAWEVSKAYAGRIAEWVLFFCMVANIIEVLPGVKTPLAVSNTILGTQAITLDIAGFGLSSLADHAREQGNEAAASRAKYTSYALIAMMMLTLILVSIKVLYASKPDVVNFVNNAEPLLVLFRVAMVVIYGHVIHGLRHIGKNGQLPPQAQDRLEALIGQFTGQLVAVQNSVQSQVQSIQLTVQSQVQDVQSAVQKVQSQVQQAVQVTVQNGVQTGQSLDTQDVQLFVQQVVQSAVQEQAKMLQGAMQSTFLVLQKRQSDELQHLLASLQRQMITEITEVQTPLLTASLVPEEAPQEALKASERAEAYIRTVVSNGGGVPSLAEIQTGSRVSKTTAINARRKMTGSTGEEN